MIIFTYSLLFIAGVTEASQVIFSPRPVTGNVAYTLPTERTFLLNIPTAYNHEESHPLVLSFHGAGGFSEKQQRITELSNPSLRIAGMPFLTAYAQGVNNTEYIPKMTHIWKGAPYENKTVDDVGCLLGRYTRREFIGVSSWSPSM
jgi:polyhydroxybutyrate depolymerase